MDAEAHLEREADHPYRVIWEFMQTFDPQGRDRHPRLRQPARPARAVLPAPTPRSYLGWGKSHALGTGLGLIMGAKLAAPDKFCVNFMGDAAFGMTGLDFETAVRNGIPTLTIVLNNNFMAAETHSMQASHERYGTMNILGNYADLAKSLGGWSERVEEPGQIVPALQRARKSPTTAKPRYWNLLRVENTLTRERRGDVDSFGLSSGFWL